VGAQCLRLSERFFIVIVKGQDIKSYGCARFHSNSNLKQSESKRSQHELIMHLVSKNYATFNFTITSANVD